MSEQHSTALISVGGWRKTDPTVDVVVDCRFFDILSRHQWAIRTKMYAVARIDGKRVFMHQLICSLAHGERPPGHEVDHIDRNVLNNRADNLRWVTRSINQANKGKQQNNTSGYRGVSWYASGKTWKAAVKKDGRIVYCRYFHDKHEAARAVNRAWVDLFPSLPAPNPDAENMPPSSPYQRAERKVNQNSSSGVRGVTWNKRLSKWAAFVQKKGKRTFLGYFVDKAEAALIVERTREKIKAGEQDNEGVI